MTKIYNEAKNIICEFLEKSALKSGDLLVIGCSSSEVMGNKIGKGSSLEAAENIFNAVYPILEERGIYLAAQCCEHLNRALVVERKAAEKYGYDIVNVIPQPKAGGSFAAVTYSAMKDPVVVEQIYAAGGIDIGDTFIGMHLKPVAVPVRLSCSSIGAAHITCAYSRPKYIGGPRAHYE